MGPGAVLTAPWRRYGPIASNAIGRQFRNPFESVPGEPVREGKMSVNAQALAFAGSSTNRKEMPVQFDHLNPESEDAVRRLATDQNYRVLRAVPKPFSSMPDNGAPPPGRCIAIVDLETSGLEPTRDRIIELAVMLLFVGDDGDVTGHFGPLSWLEDPFVST